MFSGLACRNASKTQPQRCLCNNALCQKDDYCFTGVDNEGCYGKLCGKVPTIETQYCVCAGSLCSPGQSCDYSNHLCYTPPTCPPFPHHLSEKGCICANSSVCTQSKVCYNNACIKLPTISQPQPNLNENPEGCFCKIANSICNVGEECRAQNNSCSLPVTCEDPTRFRSNISSNFSADHIHRENEEVEVSCIQNNYLYKKQVPCCDKL